MILFYRFFVFASAVFFLSSCTTNQIVIHPSHQITPDTKKTDVVKTKNSVPALGVKPPMVPPPPTAVQQTAIDELKKNSDNAEIANSIIDTKLTSSDLSAAVTDPQLTKLRPQLLLKLGKIYQKDQEIEKATSIYKIIVNNYPSQPAAAQASSLLSILTSGSEANPKVIGAILPLSGKNEAIGTHALNAIRMGLGLDKPDSKFQLVLYDTQSNPDLAAEAVDKLVKENKAIALLGGFTSKEATAIATRAEMLMTPYFAFSQKTGLTNIGDFIFRNSVTPEMQMDSLVQFAYDKLGARRFGVMYPNDSYGVEFANHFWDHVLARGGQMTAAQIYDPADNDYSEEVQKLVGLYYEEARWEEMNERIKELKEKRANGTGAQSKGPRSHRERWSQENVLPPIIDFDVLFIPDNSKGLGKILAFLKYYNVQHLTLIGTNIWNTPDLPRRLAKEKATVYFVDALDTSTEAKNDNPFLKDYLTQFNEEPSIVDIQAFEAAKILRDQLSSGISTRIGLANSLKILGRRAGVTGELRMSNQRELERPIHILSLEGGLVKKIE